MRQNDLLNRLRRRPFRPFRVHVTDGTTYDIRHPDQALPTLSTLFVSIFNVEPSSPLWEEPMILSLQHIVRLEPLAMPPPSGNGASGTS